MQIIRKQLQERVIDSLSIVNRNFNIFPEQKNL
jgi:hypothetical protein